MEREMCGYLEWRYNVPPKELKTFKPEVRRVFGRERRGGYQWDIAAATSNSTPPPPPPGQVFLLTRSTRTR